MSTSSENALIRLYRSRIGDPRGPAEAYGYWFIVLGIVLALAGVGVFMYGSLSPRGTPVYWGFREIGIVLVASGVPLASLGMAFRLPLQPIAAAVSSFGVLACGVAVAWFVTLYPSSWTFAGPQLPILTYALGVALLGAAVTFVPLVVAPIPPDEDPAAIRYPYYELRQSREGWQWLLYASDGTTLAESGHTFTDRAAARDAVADVSTRGPAASIEVTTEGER